MGDGFYRSKDPTNSIKVLKEATKENNTKNKENTKFTCIHTKKMMRLRQMCCHRYFRQGTLLHHYGEVLAIMMRLRQMCCHPFLVAKAADKITETIGQSPLCWFVTL